MKNPNTNKEVAIVKQKSAEVPAAVPATFSDKSNEPTSTSLYYFVSDYVSAYKNRDYDKMKLLFLPTASENNMDLNKTLNMYKNNFEKNKIIRYDIQIKNKSIRGSNALVDGNFIVIFNTEENKEVKTREGSIRWKLKWIDENWKIDSLNYSFNKDKEFM